MGSRFFSAVSSVVVGFLTGCIAGENAAEEQKINPGKQLSLSASRLQYLFGVIFALGAINPRDPVTAAGAGAVAFFLGYEYTYQRKMMAGPSLSPALGL